MASREEVALVSHLMRRAGFGTTPRELEEYTAKGYEAVVEEMVNPERRPEIEEDIVARYRGGEVQDIWVGTWIYRMANSRCPLVEKMALFWHHGPVCVSGTLRAEDARPLKLNQAPGISRGPGSRRPAAPPPAAQGARRSTG